MSRAELDALCEDMAAFGAPPEEIAKARADYLSAVLPAEYDVLHANVPAVRLFQALQTQWRTEALSTLGAARVVRTGLDYAAIEPTGRMMALEVDADAFSRLQVLEIHALNAWAEQVTR